MRAQFHRGISPVLWIWIGLALASEDVSAAGFQLQEQSASGLGLAYSGMPAAAQDISTAFWNPAGLKLSGGSALLASAQYVIPTITFRSAGGPPSGSTYAAFGNGGDAGVSSWVPAFYAATSLPSDVTVGLAINAPFGLSTRWSAPWAGMFRAVESRVDTVNINPVLAYRVNDVVSIGGGISYQRLRAALSEAVSPLVPAAQGRLDGSDWAWGWNLGVMLDFGQGTRLGATYRSSTDYDIVGSLAFNSPAFAALGSRASAALKLPATFGVGIAQQLAPQLRLLADYTWTGWNSISALSVLSTSGGTSGQVVLSDQLNFRNSWRVGVGTEYQLSAAWLLRAGIAYDKSPVQDAFRTPRLPDNDRRWVAVGARFAPGSSWSVDVGYAYLWVKDGSSALATSGPLPGALVGTYSLHDSILGIQTEVRF